MPRRFAGFLGGAALQLVALVLAHELVFLARYGSRFGEALVHAGHGETWSAAVETSLALAIGLVVLGVIRLAHLGSLARRRGVDRRTSTSLEPSALLRTWLRIAPRMAALTVTLLTVQENLERASLGVTTPNLAILLSPEYGAGLWIAIATSLLVSLVAALFVWRHGVLLARLRAARAALPRHDTTRALRTGIDARTPVDSLLGRRSALRAPPAASAAA